MLPDKKAELEKFLNGVASGLDKIFNGNKRGNERPTGFVLLVYPFAEFDNGNARCNYISNGADRKDMVVLMKEMIARFEGRPYQEGRA